MYRQLCSLLGVTTCCLYDVNLSNSGSTGRDQIQLSLLSVKGKAWGGWRVSHIIGFF